MAEYTQDFRLIQEALYEGKTVTGAGTGDLLREVINVMRSGGQSVRDAILEMRKDLHETILRGIGSAGAGNSHDETAKEFTPIVKELATISDRLEALRDVFAVIGSAGGHGNDAAKLSGFDVGILHKQMSNLGKTFEATDFQGKSFIEQLRILAQSVGGIRGVFQASLDARQKDAALGLLGLSSKAADLIGWFEKLGGVIRTQVIQGYQDFQKNRTVGFTGAQNLFDEFERMFTHGGTAGFSYKMLAEQTNQNVGTRTPSPLLYGQSVAELSQTLNSQVNRIQARGFDPYTQFGGSNDILRYIQDQTSFLKQTGIFKNIRPAEVDPFIQQGMHYFSDISKFTGISAEKLAELAKSTEEQLAETQALGQVTGAEAVNLKNSLDAFKSIGPGGKEIAKEVIDFLNAGRSQSGYLALHPEMVTANALSRGAILDTIEAATRLALKTNADPREAISSLIRIAQRTPENLFGAQQGNIQIPLLNKENPTMGSVASALQQIRNNDAEKIEKFNLPAGNDTVNTALGWVDRWADQHPMLFKMGEAAAHAAGQAVEFGLALLGASKILRILGGGAAGGGGILTEVGGGLLGGAVGGALTALRTTITSALRIIPPVAIGAAAHFADADETKPGGSRIGSLINEYVPGAAAADDFVYRATGGFIGTPRADPRYGGQPNEEIVGPGAPSASLPGHSSSYEDSSLSVLTEIAAASGSGNNILNRIATELANQTTILNQDSGGSGIGAYTSGQGLLTTASHIGNASSDPGGPLSGRS